MPLKHSLAVIIAFFSISCQKKGKLSAIKNKITHKVEYIDPQEALLSDGFSTCYEEKYIFNYYNDKHVRYSKNKNGLRDFILSSYQNKDYSDSGYLNIHFVVNCQGEAGRYKIYETDLDLESKSFNEDLKQQLFDLTTQLKEWYPLNLRGSDVDAYMYLSYRIEHGNIIEILP